MIEKIRNDLKENREVALLITKDEDVFLAYNLDNAVLRDSISAVQTAVSKALVKGYHPKDFKTLYLGGNSKYLNRAFLKEFINQEVKIVLVDQTNLKEINIDDLNYLFEEDL